jgi:nicotinamide-nucleotide amidase
VQIEIINTGTELMLGRVLNTHQQWLCRNLADAGYEVQRQVSVPDTGTDITQAVREALGRADLIIATGGLGPTSDDLTRDLVADLFGRKLFQDASVLAHISSFFVSRQRPQPESTKVQAQVPEGAMVLMNAFGTAPGLVLEAPPGQFRPGKGSLLVMLPGPPRELRPMFTDQVLPLLRAKLPQQEEYACVTLKTTGIGESRAEEIIAPRLAALMKNGLELGYCARVGEVDLRFAARGPQANSLVNAAADIVRKVLPHHTYGEGDDTLEAAVVRLLTERHQSLATAESCTGGFVSHRLTNVPGASAVLWGGWVTYANEAKEKQLDVDPALLARHGAVSEPVAAAMAAGARARSQADYAVAVTGIAGPGGGTPEKPVGTVFIGVASPTGVEVREYLNRFDRETFKFITSQQALEMVRRTILGLACGGPP